jgi:hypothetical protein
VTRAKLNEQGDLSADSTQNKRGIGKGKGSSRANVMSLNSRPAGNGLRKVSKPMIDQFLFERYSEELYAVNEAEYDEVMAELTTLDLGTQVPKYPSTQVLGFPITQYLFEGNDKRGAIVEESIAWQGSKQFSGIFVKKACEHLTCPHTRCARSLRVGGIEI